jgi:hypothetical protein
MCVSVSMCVVPPCLVRLGRGGFHPAGGCDGAEGLEPLRRPRAWRTCDVRQRSPHTPRALIVGVAVSLCLGVQAQFKFGVWQTCMHWGSYKNFNVCKTSTWAARCVRRVRCLRVSRRVVV